MRIINFITEGQCIPRGIYIKYGYPPKEYKFKEYKSVVTRGEDGLVESILMVPQFERIEDDPRRFWITFGLSTRWFHMSYRIRSWDKNIFHFDV